MAAKHFDQFAQNCADKLADLIEAGKAPWSLEGTPAEYPVDALSGRPLEGITALQLIAREKSSGFKDNRWLTPDQIAALGGSVKKGARGVPSISWKQNLSGESEPTKIPRTYFNVEQCENLNRLPPFTEVKHDPEALLGDLCSYLGLTQKHTFSFSGPAFVSVNGELIFSSSHFYDPSGKNYQKERLNKALDGLLALSNAFTHKQWQSFATRKDTLDRNENDYANEYALRQRLAQTFMQSHAGGKLPIHDKDVERTDNICLARLIRKHPSVLFEACADISKTVNRHIEESERSFIFLDFERQDAKILKAGQIRDYVAQELRSLNPSGSVLADPEFQKLQQNLNTRGYFNPYHELQTLLDPESKKILCSKLNHCGFSFRENTPPKDRTDNYGVQTLLRLAHARSPLMGKRTEETLTKSLIVPDFNRQQWLKEQQEKSAKRENLPDISPITQLWDDIAYRKRQISSQKSPFSLNNCWLVDFEKNRIEVVPTEKAVSRCLELMDEWHEKTPLSAGQARRDLSYQYEKLLDERRERPSTDAPFIKAIESNKDADVCDRFLSPARSGDGEGNIVLRDLGHRGLVICRSVKELLETTSWQGEELTAQVELLFKKAGLDFNQVKEICKPKTEPEAQQSFTDFCAAQRTRYAVESAKREKAEKAALKDAMSRMNPQTMEEVKRNICTALSRMTERTKAPQQQTVQETQKTPERKTPSRGMSR